MSEQSNASPEQEQEHRTGQSGGDRDLSLTDPCFIGWLDNDLKNSNNFLDDDDDVDDLGKIFIE